MKRKPFIEKITGIILSLIQLLLTIVLLCLLLIFKYFSVYTFIALIIVCFALFIFTFLSQQSKYYRLLGRYIAIGADFLLLIACIACFVI